METKKRVFVTGIGVVSPVGIGREEFWTSLENMVDGSAVEEELIQLGSTSTKTCKVKINNFKQLLDTYNHRRFSKNMKFAISAIELAIKDANIDLFEYEEYRKGLIFNTVRGSYESTVNFLETLYTKGPEFLSPLKFPLTVTNSPATPVSVKYKLKGASTVLQGSSSMLLAFNKIRNDEADVIICGGVDVIYTSDLVMAFSQNNMLATKANGIEELSRPADINRNGIIYGEASAFVVLENEESLIKRNGTAYSEVIGCGAAYDYSAVRIMTNRSADKFARSMNTAIKDAGITPSQIDYINSAANSSKELDLAEATAIKEVFNSSDTPVGNYKGSTGEVFGASETLGVIQSSLSLYKNEILPIANLSEIDPELGLTYVMKGKLFTGRLKHAVTNAVEIGGNISSIILKKAEGKK